MTETAPTWPHERPDYESLAAAVQGEAARWNVPGMTAAVLHDGKRQRAATGVTNLEHPAPATPDTRFQVGSISKVFTATAMEEIRRWALKRWLNLEVRQREAVDADAATLDAVAGRYARHDAEIDVTRAGGHLRVSRRTIEHEDQLSHERHEDDPPIELDAYPTGDGVYRVLEGPYRDTLVEFLEERLFAGDDEALESRQILRASGRLAERR